MSAPRRLLDDPGAAPWLAERIRGALGSVPMPAAERTRVGERLAARLEPGDRAPVWAWPLTAALALGAILVLARAGAPAVVHGAQDRLQEHPDLPAASAPATAAASATAPAGRSERAASTVASSSEAKPGAQRRARKPHPGTHHSAAAPAWLADAHAALATDPARTLALIRSHRDPAVPVTPEVLELTIRALDAQRLTRSQQARAQQP